MIRLPRIQEGMRKVLVGNSMRQGGNLDHSSLPGNERWYTQEPEINFAVSRNRFDKMTFDVKLILTIQ